MAEDAKIGNAYSIRPDEPNVDAVDASYRTPRTIRSRFFRAARLLTSPHAHPWLALRWSEPRRRRLPH